MKSFLPTHRKALLLLWGSKKQSSVPWKLGPKGKGIEAERPVRAVGEAEQEEESEWKKNMQWGGWCGLIKTGRKKQRSIWTHECLWSSDNRNVFFLVTDCAFMSIQTLQVHWRGYIILKWYWSLESVASFWEIIDINLFLTLKIISYPVKIPSLVKSEFTGKNWPSCPCGWVTSILSDFSHQLSI